MLEHIRHLSLTRQILYLIAIMLILLLISFMATNQVAKQIIERKVTDSVEKISLQVMEKMDSIHADMEGISMFLFYAPTVQSYLNTDDEMTRVLNNQDILAMFDHTNSMKTNIRGIQLYDTAGRQLARFGEGDNAVNIKPVQKLTYTGVLKLESRPHERFYAITTPIFGIDSNGIATELKGIGRFYMDASFFVPILKNAAITPNSQVVLLDGGDRLIASDGTAAAEDRFDVSEWNDRPGSIVQAFSLPHSGWKLVNIMPRHELLGELGTVQRLNFVTYLVMLILLQLFIMLFARRVLKPIKSLVDFVKTYPKLGEESRFEVVMQNEIGLLGTSLNTMLDEIRDLSREVQGAQKRMYEIELAKKQMEISAYRNQINPHFLYNTLESIRAVAFYRDVPEIASISESLSRMFRYIVKGGSIVTLADELAHVQEYMRIVDFRFRGRFGFQLDVQQGLESVRMLKMLLQPLVENAVFHGLERKVGPGTVGIEVGRLKDGRIRVSVRDDGLGMDSGRLEEIAGTLRLRQEPEREQEGDSTGIGMLNIYRRMKLFYGEEAEMNVSSRHRQGTVVTLTFPEDLQGDEESAL